MKNQKREIAFINQNSGYLMIDIINAHLDTWNEIVLITGKIIERDIPLHPSVQVRKIISYQRGSSFKRLLTWLVGSLQILWLLKTKYRKAHLFIVSNPPFAPLLPIWCSNPYSLLIFDIYPDALVEHKILRSNSIFIKWWQKSNQQIFQKALNIFVLSSGMKRIVGQYVSTDKVLVTPLWTQNEFFRPIDKIHNPFVKQYELQNKFIVLYSGNIGLSHGIEVLIRIAAKITNPDILFLIIGEGEKKKALKEEIDALALTNCMLLPWQDVSMLRYSMAAADLGVVSLGKAASLLSVPSKTYNLLSVGVPLLCFADKRSELAELIDQYKCGKCFDFEDTEEVITYVNLISTDMSYWRALRERSIEASFDFTSENVDKLVVA